MITFFRMKSNKGLNEINIIAPETRPMPPSRKKTNFAFIFLLLFQTKSLFDIRHLCSGILKENWSDFPELLSKNNFTAY